MYAIIETGGKQYKAVVGEVLMIEKLNAAEEEQVEFERVLAIVRDDGVVLTGSPFVSGAMVGGKVLVHGKGPKIRGFKFRNKTNYRRRYGHRQPYTKVVVESITGA